MTSEYETCRNNLEQLASLYSQADRNEATTRLLLIDHLFFECLGWSKYDAVLEESYQQDYADYTFNAPRRVLIVEAKKEGNYFELPAGKVQLEYSIPTLTRDNSNLKAALEQAARYCQSRGVPFGVVSNGHQVVAFIATRSDGLPPLDGKALVFPSLDFMLKNFLDLWNALSKPGVEDKKLQFRLIGEKSPQLPSKISENLPIYPGSKSRNIFQTDIQTVSDLVIEDLSRSHELETRFLEECYCQSGALSQYSLVSKAILQTRYAALFDSTTPGPTTTPAVSKDGISSELLAESLSRRPILLIGDVGVGKTTFVRHLIKVEAVSLFENAITLYIDLGSQANLSIDLKSFVPQEISEQLREQFQIDIEERNFVHAVYNAELKRFNKGIYADLKETNPALYREKEIQFLEEKINNQEQHLKYALQHITKGRRQQIVMFLDNADQRSDETQQQAFLIAQEVAEHWPVTIFVALRPETFYRSMRIGALSGYHPKAFTISPPRIDRVIEKRLSFALKLTSGEIPIQSLSETIQVRLRKLEEIIHVFLQSLENNELAEFIDNISGGNIRLALDLVRGFFGSGHVDTRKIIEIYNESGKYNIPLHEFLRAVIFGDGIYYDPNQSPILNLFDITYFDSKEHFLLPLAIGFLASSSGLNAEEGFIETSSVYEQLQGLGFTPEQIDSAIVRGSRKKLIETVARRIPQPGQPIPQALRATSVGVYHITRLSRLFTYIDAVIVDTPVLDRTVRESIRDVHNLGERLDRSEIFRQYLDNQWSTLNHSGAWFNWNDVSGHLKKQIETIRNKTA